MIAAIVRILTIHHVYYWQCHVIITTVINVLLVITCCHCHTSLSYFTPNGSGLIVIVITGFGAQICSSTLMRVGLATNPVWRSAIMAIAAATAEQRTGGHGTDTACMHANAPACSDCSPALGAIHSCLLFTTIVCWATSGGHGLRAGLKVHFAYSQSEVVVILTNNDYPHPTNPWVKHCKDKQTPT